MKKSLLALFVVVFGATFVVSSAQAQRRGSAPARGGHGRIGFARGHRMAGARQSRARGFNRGGVYAPYSYSDFGYASDLGFDSAYEPTPESPSPQIVSQQISRAAAPPPPPKPAEGSVILEVQGDHWVRISSNGPPRIVGQVYQPELKQASSQPAAAPSAVLVFRDGHQEEIGNYCIIGATIHVNTNYWSTGSWSRLVPISNLDVSATVRLNQERGSNFRLPSGPNDVIVGG